MKNYVHYRGVSQAGPAVLAFADLMPDGKWSGIHLGAMESMPALETEADAIAWVRESAADIVKQAVALPGENLAVIVLGLTQKSREASYLGRPGEADAKIWDGWRKGFIKDVNEQDSVAKKSVEKVTASDLKSQVGGLKLRHQVVDGVCLHCNRPKDDWNPALGCPQRRAP